MTTTFIAAASATDPDGFSGCTVAKPAGTQDGDIMLAAGLAAGAAGGAWVLPAGWTQLDSVASGGTYSGQAGLFYKVAGASEPSTYLFSNAGLVGYAGWRTTIVAYRGGKIVQAHGGAAQGGSNHADIVTPSTAFTGLVLPVLLFTGWAGTSGGDVNRTLSIPAGCTSRALTGGGSSAAVVFVADMAVTSTSPIAAATSTTTDPSSAGGPWLWEDSVGFCVGILANVAPNAPTPGYPSGGVSINRTAPQRLNHGYSDDDPGDTETQHEERYRLVGTSVWTTVAVDLPVLYTDVPAGTFVDGFYERQVRSRDSFGVWGPWSSSWFFTATSPPPGPTITAPVNGSAIGTQMAALTWTGGGTSYQVRKLAGVSGVADLDSVLFDSGEIFSPIPDATSFFYVLAFPVNNREEHLQVRTRDGVLGLWSHEVDENWSSVRVQVSYTAPPAPTVTVTAVGRHLEVSATHPTPTGSEPTVVSIGVWRRELPDHDQLEHRARNLSPLATFSDEFVSSVRGYEFMVEAVGDNGVSSFSQWVAGPGELAGAGYGEGYEGGYE